MQAHALGRDFRRRGVQRCHIGLDHAQEAGFVQVLVAGVPRHREVGAIELEVEPGLDDRLVFGAHGLDEVGEISLVRGIVLVGLERGHQPRRGCIHERPHAISMPVERRAEAANIVAGRLKRPQPHRADTGGTDEFLAAHNRGELLGERRVRRQIERRLAIDMPAEPGEPLGDVGRVADLPKLAVADDRDAGRDLFLHGVVDGALDDLIELSRVVRLAVILREEERGEFVAARQAPDMRDIDRRAAI